MLCATDEPRQAGRQSLGEQAPSHTCKCVRRQPHHSKPEPASPWHQHPHPLTQDFYWGLYCTWNSGSVLGSGNDTTSEESLTKRSAAGQTTVNWLDEGWLLLQAEGHLCTPASSPQVWVYWWTPTVCNVQKLPFPAFVWYCVQISLGCLELPPS